MRLNAINSFAYKPSFGDALSSKQEAQYRKFLDDVKHEQCFDGGLGVVKVYAPSIPSSEEEDTGLGKITSDEANKIYDIAKTYYNATGVKIMPLGPLTDKPTYNNKHYTGAYNRGALSIGEDVINLFDLTTKEFGNILPREKAEAFVGKHYDGDCEETLADFETTLGWKNQEEYPVNDALQIAFDNFKNIKKPGKELKALRQEFEEFKNKKEPVDYDDIYTRLALFPLIKDYKAEVELFQGFDSNPEERAKKMPQYEAYKEQYKNEIEFYKFKQFLGHKTLQKAKNNINGKGMDFVGDCIIGFSWPECQVFPDAFLPNAGIGWGLPALNIYDIKSKNDSPAHQLLKTKVAHHLLQYDSVRFDVGWQYMKPKIHFKNGAEDHPYIGTKITDLIEQTAREIKGDNFDQRKLMYECDANFTDFPLQIEGTRNQVRNLQGLAILSTENEHNEGGGWGNMKYVREVLQLGQDDTINGTNTHDGKGIHACAVDSETSSKQVGGMMHTFGLDKPDKPQDSWKLLKKDNDPEEHMKRYVRGRFAEIATCKNTFIQLFDLMGRKERVDYHTGGDSRFIGYERDYKNRLERNFEENFHLALQAGKAYNAADAHKFRMEHDGTKERRPDLYERACKWAAYLGHAGGINTKEQADNSSRADLDIESLSVSQIDRLA